MVEAPGLLSNPLDPYNFSEPLEISDVMGQQTRYVISQHSSYDIGVMNLLAADLKIPQQLDGVLGDSGGIVRHMKLCLQITHVLGHHLRR